MSRPTQFDAPMPEATCPACGYKMDRVFNRFGTDGPRPGVICLCAGCGDALLFNLDMTLRAMTPDELMALPIEHRRQVIHIRGVLAEAREKVKASP